MLGIGPITSLVQALLRISLKVVYFVGERTFMAAHCGTEGAARDM